METLTLIIIIIAITIIAFTSVNISYKSTGGDINTNTVGTAIPLNSKPAKLDIGKFNPYASSHALYNLPAKDQYMSQEFRDQIDKLRTQYYYNNCASGSSAK